LIAWLALLTIFRPSDYLIESNMRIAVGLTVLTCLFMGLQRQQPDMSFWHMWIYASLFYLSSKNYNEV